MDIGDLFGEGNMQGDFEFGDATVTIRYINREDLLAIGRKVNKKLGRKANADDDKDDGESNRLLGETVVLGWSNIKQRGVDVPFTPENRDKMMRLWGDFCTFVNTTCTDLQAMVDATKEVARKKS